MRYLLLVCIPLLSVLIPAEGNAQVAVKTFRQVAKVLDGLTSVQYDSYREINNYKDNYFSKNSGTSYFDFDPEADGGVSGFQLRSERTLQVYNGTEYFVLNEADKTAEFGKRKATSLSNLSLLFNSIATLRISLPVIAEDAAIPKSVKDTTIEGKACRLLKFELHKKTLEFPGGFSSFEAEVTRYYDLVVDAKTLLPYIIIDRNSIMKDQYYTKTIFTNINNKPERPAASSWFFSSYTGYSPKQSAKQKPLVETGASMPQWTLPEYKGDVTDSIGQSALKGKKVLMEFWIKNCGYCMAAFPEIKSLQEKYGKSVDILTVNAYDEQKEIEFFYKRERPAYKMLYNGEKLANSLGIYSFPTFLVLDEGGKVIYSHAGFNKEQIEAVLGK